MGSFKNLTGAFVTTKFLWFLSICRSVLDFYMASGYGKLQVNTFLHAGFGKIVPLYLV